MSIVKCDLANSLCKNRTTFNYFFKYTAAIFLPQVLLIGVAITYCVIKHPRNPLSKMSDQQALSTTITMAFIIVFILYPFVSQTIFQGFSCRALAEDESWLTADYQVSCEGVAWKFWLFWGVLTAMLWPVGVPVFTLLILLRNKDMMWVRNSPERDKFAFIVGDYKPQYFFWECLEMLRKVSLTGLLIFFSKGSLLQIIVAVMITFAFLIGTARNMPFKDELANNFKLATECCLLITLVFAIMLKVDLRKEAVSADQIGFILLLNNTIVPGATLVLGYLMAMKAATEVDHDHWYRGTYDVVTGIVKYAGYNHGIKNEDGTPVENPLDQQHPDWIDPDKNDEVEDDEGMHFEMDNPMMDANADDEDFDTAVDNPLNKLDAVEPKKEKVNDEFTAMSKKELTKALKGADLSKKDLSKASKNENTMRKALRKKETEKTTLVFSNVLAESGDFSAEDVIGSDEEVDTVDKVDENLDVEEVAVKDEFTAMNEKELKKALKGAGLSKKELTKASKSKGTMRTALRKQQLAEDERRRAAREKSAEAAAKKSAEASAPAPAPKPKAAPNAETEKPKAKAAGAQPQKAGDIFAQMKTAKAAQEAGGDALVTMET